MVLFYHVCKGRGRGGGGPINIWRPFYFICGLHKNVLFVVPIYFICGDRKDSSFWLQKLFLFKKLWLLWKVNYNISIFLKHWNHLVLIIDFWLNFWLFFFLQYLPKEFSYVKRVDHHIWALKNSFLTLYLMR